MPNYYEKLLNIVNKDSYRLPEGGVFEALEEFKLQCNQVLAYKHMSIHFRHFIRDASNPNDDGGYIALHGLGNVFISNIAMWTYDHPYHTFPICLRFDQQKYLCHTRNDMEIALNALIDSKIFERFLSIQSE